jgi:anthranilate phosphoribosyltransferase
VSARDALRAVLDGRALDETEAQALFEGVLAGTLAPAEIGAMLMAMRARGERVGELVGAARVLRAHAVAVPGVPPGAVDTCGTGGDGARTFNVSTAAALVVAGAGVPVAKHGNRAVSSTVGSADVLEALGVTVELPPARLAACVREVGIAFLYAPSLHPALARVGPVRRELGVRTIFNLLGPLVNPAGVRRQVIGVPEARWIEPMATALARLGTDHAWVVHGGGGLDELGLDAPSTVARVRGTTIERDEVRPERLGLTAAPVSALVVGSAAESAARIEEVLAGALGPSRDVVVLNAAAALVVGDAVRDLRDGLDRAAASIDGGRARSVLDGLRAFTRASREAAS